MLVIAFCITKMDFFLKAERTENENGGSSENFDSKAQSDVYACYVKIKTFAFLSRG